MKEFATNVYRAVEEGRLKEPFDAAALRQACPDWADRTYRNFPPKHRVGNPSGTTELFEQVGHGLYRTLPSLRRRG